MQKKGTEELLDFVPCASHANLSGVSQQKVQLSRAKMSFFIQTSFHMSLANDEVISQVHLDKTSDMLATPEEYAQDELIDDMPKEGKRDDDVKIKVDQIDISEDSSTPSFKADKVGSDCSSPLLSGSAYNSNCMDLNMMVDEILTSKRHPSIRKEKKRRFKMTYEQA